MVTVFKHLQQVVGAQCTGDCPSQCWYYGWAINDPDAYYDYDSPVDVNCTGNIHNNVRFSLS